MDYKDFARELGLESKIIGIRRTDIPAGVERVAERCALAALSHPGAI